MSYLFTSESVSNGHPDKIADQIADSIVDNFLAQDSNSHCAIETLVTAGQVVIAGEVNSNAYVDVDNCAREMIKSIGYDKSEYGFDYKSCGILTSIHAQSSDINQGVEREELENQGAGDQGIMFGYATNETESYMPATLDIAHKILQVINDFRINGKLTYLRPDAKTQVTIEYSSKHIPRRIHSIVVSVSHDNFNDDETMHNIIEEDIKTHVIPEVIKLCDEKTQKLFNDEIKYYINPTGKFVICGPASDCGVTGRKLIVDSYGGWGAIGGGAQSGKDPSKVDRSALYVTRYIAKNAVAANIADRMLIQISYAIGVAEPISFTVNTYGTAHVHYSDEKIAQKLQNMFDLRPYSIIEHLKLKEPIYEETAAYGQVGQTPKIVSKLFKTSNNQLFTKEVELFTWEKLDLVDVIKKEFEYPSLIQD